MLTFVRMVVAIAVLLLGPAASRAIMPRRVFLAAINHACPHCGPYLKVLRQIADNPARIRELFAKRRKVYFPGAKSMVEARILAAEAVKVEVAWYREEHEKVTSTFIDEPGARRLDLQPITTARKIF